jgi:hypothetical protein
MKLWDACLSIHEAYAKQPDHQAAQCTQSAYSTNNPSNIFSIYMSPFLVMQILFCGDSKVDHENGDSTLL